LTLALSSEETEPERGTHGIECYRLDSPRPNELKLESELQFGKGIVQRRAEGSSHKRFEEKKRRKRKGTRSVEELVQLLSTTLYVTLLFGMIGFLSL
jgi:hypothetical protein